MIEKWLAVHGLTLADYIEHLWSSGTTDGLKVWLLLMATDTPVNIFQEDRVCSTSQQGLDLEYPSIVLMTYHSGVWCKEGSNEAEAGPPLEVQPVVAPRKTVGRPCIKEEVYQDKDSSTETDPDDLLEVLVEVRVPVLPSGVPWPQQCPLCNDHLDSGLALERHIRSLHPLLRSYSCRDCEMAFITPCQLASHVSNVHRQKKVSCKKCEYITVSKAKMRQHICKHMSGVQCK